MRFNFTEKMVKAPVLRIPVSSERGVSRLIAVRHLFCGNSRFSVNMVCQQS